MHAFFFIHVIFISCAQLLAAVFVCSAVFVYLCLFRFKLDGMITWFLACLINPRFAGIAAVNYN